MKKSAEIKENIVLFRIFPVNNRELSQLMLINSYMSISACNFVNRLMLITKLTCTDRNVKWKSAKTTFELC